MAIVGQGIRALEQVVQPRALNGTFFSDRIEGMDPDTSSAIVAALASAALLNATGFLAEDPRCVPPPHPHPRPKPQHLDGPPMLGQGETSSEGPETLKLNTPRIPVVQVLGFPAKTCAGALSLPVYSKQNIQFR